MQQCFDLNAGSVVRAQDGQEYLLTAFHCLGDKVTTNRNPNQAQIDQAIYSVGDFFMGSAAISARFGYTVSCDDSLTAAQKLPAD